MPVALCGWCRHTVFITGISPIFSTSYLGLIKVASSSSASDALWPKGIRGKLCRNCNKAAEFSDSNFTQLTTLLKNSCYNFPFFLCLFCLSFSECACDYEHTSRQQHLLCQCSEIYFYCSSQFRTYILFSHYLLPHLFLFILYLHSS